MLFWGWHCQPDNIDLRYQLVTGGKSDWQVDFNDLFTALNNLMNHVINPNYGKQNNFTICKASAFIPN